LRLDKKRKMKTNKKSIKNDGQISEFRKLRERVDTIKFLPEDKKTLLRKAVVDIAKRRNIIFKNPDCLGAQIFCKMEFQKAVRELAEKRIWECK
jgi:hypothetical protein